MAKAAEAMAKRDRPAVHQYVEQLTDLVRRKEPRIHRVFDVRTFIWAWQDAGSPHSIIQL